MYNPTASAYTPYKVKRNTRKGVFMKSRLNRYIPLLMFALLLFAILIFLFYQKKMIFAANTGDRKLPIYCVQTEEKKIALTFDAAWGNEDTGILLDILKKHNIKATFFATGGWVSSYPEDVKKILAEGHDLGNHSENHKNMSTLNHTEQEEEIMLVHNRVKQLTDYEMFLFRPPYGDYDEALIDCVTDCGYYAIQWDVDSLDWKDYGTDSIIRTVTEHKHLGNGSIILMHNGAKYTASALERIIVSLQSEGYEFVPLSELIIKEDYTLDHEGRQIPQKTP